MELANLAKELSDIERKTLEALSIEGYATITSVSEKTGINIDSARRSAEWLREKCLVDVHETKTSRFALTPEGKRAFKEGLAENTLLRILTKEGSMSFKELQEKTGFSQQEFNIALGENKKLAYLVFNKGKVEASGVNEDVEKPTKLEITLKAVNDGSVTVEESKEDITELLKRGLVQEESRSERELRLTENGKKVKELLPGIGERSFDVRSPAPTLRIGKKQPYIQFLNNIRRKLTELGFVEMESPLIVHEFYNFDVLFQPQNHPARTWTDTYQLKNPTHGKLEDKTSVKAIKDAHEHGGVSASSGWGYTWLEEIAEKVMPAAHGTAHSARQLTKGVKSPGKYFAIARCFRPDVLDATHLIEFNQTEGFIVGENLNFKHLLGILEQFAKEIAGAEEVRFYPDYYPFTEPSVQLSAKHPKLGWVELGGAGMFRPEIMENLGIKGQAIAWGIGIDRLAMFKLGIKDIRYLFSDNIDWLRKTGQVMD